MILPLYWEITHKSNCQGALKTSHNGRVQNQPL
jgi:hypothetical protein